MTPGSDYFPTPKSWTINWKRGKIISYRNNLISWNQFYKKYREINFILEVVFIKLISGKKFVKSIFHSILPNTATFPKWIMWTRFPNFSGAEMTQEVFTIFPRWIMQTLFQSWNELRGFCDISKMNYVFSWDEMTLGSDYFPTPKILAFVTPGTIG